MILSINSSLSAVFQSVVLPHASNLISFLRSTLVLRSVSLDVFWALSLKI